MVDLEISTDRYLEFFLQFDVPETPQIVVGGSRIVNEIAGEEAEGLWRILAEDIVATDSESTVVQDRFPARYRIGRRAFNRFAILTGNNFPTALQEASHWLRFNRWCENQAVRGLPIDEVSRVGPMLMDVVREG